jgi:hypothetical protein
MKHDEENLGIIDELRRSYHSDLMASVWGFHGQDKLPSNADRGSVISKRLAGYMLEIAEGPTNNPLRSQSAGLKFTEVTRDFLERTFAALSHLRPGNWRFSTTTGSLGITAFDQYAHLAVLKAFLDSNRQNDEFRSAFSSDYLVHPDIVVTRSPISDAEVNAQDTLVNPSRQSAHLTPLRSNNTGGREILHASVSCKWTIRSDRAQNTRTEALNLIRNRKGNTPHIVVVTGEPMPTRLASIALGTGDIDCVYHMALIELQRAVEISNDESQKDMLDTLVNGRRLRDISDLPFDLAI